MSILSSAHVHTNYCDGKVSARQMIERAIELGFVSLGFTSHAAQHFEPKYSIDPGQEQAYIAELRSLQKEYTHKLRIHVGIERDLFSFADCAPYDYILASLHYLPTATGYVPVDGNKEKLRAYVDEVFHGDGLMLAKTYYNFFSGYVRAYRPQIVGHFDIVRKNNIDNCYFDENGAEYLSLACAALDGIQPTGALLEVNTGGIPRYGMKSPYPSTALLHHWHRIGGNVIVTSDCHDPQYLDAAFDQMPAFLRDCGFKYAFRLGTCNMLFEKITL